MKINVKINGQAYEVEVGDTSARPIQVEVGGEKFEVWPEEEQLEIESSTVSETPKAAAQAVVTPVGGSARMVTAPIPGVIESVKVKPGDAVAIGQELLVLEAMKMKNSIKSTRSGKVAAIHVAAGDHVAHGASLVEFTD